MTYPSQIRASLQARAFFKKSCEKVDVPYLELILWIRTRWASLFAFLDRTLILKKVSQRQKSVLNMILMNV